jgi:hypothetical protein
MIVLSTASVEIWARVAELPPTDLLGFHRIRAAL